MKRRIFLKNTSAAGLIALITPAGIFKTRSRLVQGSSLPDSFRNPPASARPHTWWHWMNGNVTKEGITLDLEAMQRVGIGGFQNFDAGTGIPEGPVKYLSPEWLELKQHAIKEAERLGLEFTMHNCPGWSSSGGPWITPERAMHQISWSETRVKGGRKVKITLPKPFINLGYYQDIAVLAFPSLEGEASFQDLLKSVTSSNGKLAVKQFTADDAQGITIDPAGEGNAGFLQFEFKEPYEARSISFLTSPLGGGRFGGGPAASLKLEASDDGNQFRELTTFSSNNQIAGSGEEVFLFAEFPATRAKYFRLSSQDTRHYAQIRFSSAARLDNWMKKANFRFTGEGIFETSADKKEVLASSVIYGNSIVELTQNMDAEGVLDWKAPAGNWTIIRMGFTPMGTLNRSAPDTGIGLECDKYSAEAMEFHFYKMMEELLPTLGPLASNGKVGLLIDSYEVGMQNWTPQFPQEFRKRMGYDLIKYLPAMTGRVVESEEVSNRFLWDLRRSQADLMADNYYGKFTDLCHEHGMISYTQPYDRGPMEEMQIGSRIDINIGEFWNSLSTLFQNNLTMRRTVKLSSSIAHVNGQKVVGAESFTGEPESARWQEYPFALKALGDKKFTEGLNRIIFHRFAHQPHPTAKPGMTMGPWGIHFDRTNTWWEQGKAWMNYLARCQNMLQQGLFVADLAYFTSEEPGGYTDVNRDELFPAPPEGYDYDLMNAEVIMNRVSIDNGRLVLPDGMSYRALVLQNPKGVTLKLMQKLHGLVKQGMILIGPKPEETLGLADFLEGQERFDSLVNELWGSTNGTTVTSHSFGRGRVYWGMPLQGVLDEIGLKPDFKVSSRSGDAPITYIHRRIEDADLYFISNQRRKYEDLVCSFRVQGMQPELWNADTGSVTPVGLYEQDKDYLRVPLKLEPYGSTFVVFHSPASSGQLQAVKKGNTALLSTKPYPEVSRKLYPEVVNNFTISFWAKPEFNVMLSTANFMDHIADPWTDYYAVYPPSGDELYGKGHATAGLTVGRNGVAVWEHGPGGPVFALAAPTPVSGWSHVALVYQDGAPSVYLNGQLIEEGKASGKKIHPGLSESTLAEGASYYNGDMSEPKLYSQALSRDRIRELVAEGAPVRQEEVPTVEMAGHDKPGILFWQDGSYSLLDSKGKETAISVKGISQPIEVSGPWQVDFPPNLGAPEQITLPSLMSLHKNNQEGVKFFSGTATYSSTFEVPAKVLSEKTKATRRLFLDLGQVEVLAEVKLNGKDLGVLWKRPYLVEVTEALQGGNNSLEIKVTNLWPNRLIGDEHLPEENQYTPGGGASGFASLSSGAIQELPQWYVEGEPQPSGGRIAFATWQHYSKDSPLLESGLIGPVQLRMAEFNTVPDKLSSR